MEKTSNKSVLVTGGSGFIGSHLTDQLLAAGNKVVCLDNLNEFYNPRIKELNRSSHSDYDEYTFVKGDIRDSELVSQLFEKNDFEVVVHLAAMAGVRPSIEDPLLYTDVNINGTQTLLEAMQKSNVQKFLFASSSSVYGNNKKTPFSEDDIVDFQISPYGATKKMGEVMCYTYHHLSEIPTSCLRFFTVYGPRQRPEMAIHKFTRMMKRGEAIPFFGDGSTARDYTYIDDIINGIFGAMNAEDQYAIYNLGNSEPVKLDELVHVIGERVGVDPKLERQALPAGDVLQTFSDVSRAKSRLDYEAQISIDVGVSRFVDWYDEMTESHGELF
ncbi:MAG: SDR family NAD(P)-dependent oxidoreductase [Candidatus Marinimicrobia bacterium]|jgi:UDP-glucuronate 4-epimerase|nr:SDR family NAD(P)-dependent oxidoreductase [Candidatus Neomarinimicrobiota bacterium]MBT3675614.1 SDR family NAD(P)-dependent oxidoreductase [Candidatus Neomarinimicrobiota bacterium]MBT3762551.1 SDR family NAD(P)-dependent oxidoreductase [Candidatus Neomarinimicrobiota bacterium]MBT4067157.1 SDR family NAD(P)-dependent oxidoreductase [Candidatus Neomarinimicrobiota bacterium]MBT4270019.1 SDR family NAD(P)-dependent oxidoreductase [Candidatus Neomarinimicrobiota bacterium]